MALGWLIILTGLLFIPIFAIIEGIDFYNNFCLYNTKVFFTSLDLFSKLKKSKKGIKRGKNVLKPAEDWGPYLQQHRGERYADMQEPSEKLKFRFLKKI